MKICFSYPNKNGSIFREVWNVESFRANYPLWSQVEINTLYDDLIYEFIIYILEY